VGTVGPHTSHDTDHFENLRPLRQLEAPKYVECGTSSFVSSRPHRADCSIEVRDDLCPCEVLNEKPFSRS